MWHGWSSHFGLGLLLRKSGKTSCFGHNRGLYEKVEWAKLCLPGGDSLFFPIRCSPIVE